MKKTGVKAPAVRAKTQAEKVKEARKKAMAAAKKKREFYKKRSK